MPLPALHGSFREGQGVQGRLLARDGRQDRAVRRRAHRPLELHQVQTDVNRGGGKIGHLNFVKGDFAVVMESGSLIHNQNKVSSIGRGYHDVYLVLKEGSRIGVKCLLDMTDSIVFGKCSRLAGADTQIWTHGFVYSADGTRFVRLDAPVLIADHVYIGTRCTILSGVKISAHITVGACSCVSKSLTEAGLYVGQGLRHLEYDADAKLKGYENPVASTFVFRRNGEEYYNYQ